MWPRNKWLNCYLHRFLRSDDDRALHDHPWAFLSIILRGGYWEHRSDGLSVTRKHRGTGSIAFRPATTAHRVELESVGLVQIGKTTWDNPAGPQIKYWKDGGEKPCTTLIFTGPVVRAWGFLCPSGWTHWKRFTYGGDGSTATRGCGEE